MALSTRRFAETSEEPKIAEEANTPSIKLKLLEAERDKYKELYIRAVSEQENIRKRLSIELENERDYATTKFAKEIIEVSDNLKRTLDSVPKEGLSKAMEELIEGVSATRRQLYAAFKKFDVEEYESLGAKFDPNKHQALYTYPDPSLPEGVVGTVVAPGYLIKDKVLRIAKVGVVKNE